MASAAATAYAYHHLVLPPKLPQQDDRNAAHDLTLVNIAIHALESLKSFVNSEHVGSVEVAVITVKNLRRCRDHHGNNSEGQVQDVLANVANGVATGKVPLEIKEQNAGILVGRSSDNLVFEFFELSPTNEAAMHPGRLVREFPAHASQIPIGKVNPDLIESISRTIATMTTQTAPGFQPKITKNNKSMDEQRDTTHPGMTTDFFSNLIAAFGEPTDVRHSTKYTREEVLWNDCFAPWRRSPLWLLLRVSLQLLFSRQAPSSLHADGLYKAFMIFMLSRLLDLGKQHWKDLGSEAIHITLAKLSRRLRKFELLKQEGYLQPGWAQHIHDRMINAHKFIKHHWQDQIDNSQANIDFSTVAQLKPKADVDMKLSGLDAFLLAVTSRQREVSSSTFTPTSGYPSYPATQLPESIKSFGSHEDKYFRLAAFEKWVEHHLVDWYTSHLHDGDACGSLRTIMTSYYDVASSTYAGVPVGLSIMYLTLTGLWIACDRIACTIYPMLLDYDPEVDLAEFQCLTLPLKSHLNRLDASERYVRMRQATAVKGRPSVYRRFGDPDSFSVRYFDRCETLQATLSDIELDAAAKRKRKCKELADLKLQYQQYMDQYNSNVCEEVWEIYNRRHGYRRKVHSNNCSRCAAKAKADFLTIRIYEWPVSSKTPVAKATVFELAVPDPYSNWRDASAHFITTVLGYKDANQLRPSHSYTLNNHQDLSHLLSNGYHRRRIVPLSNVKSHTATHRKLQKAIPHLNDDDVCLDNALQYAYYDVSSGIFNASMPSCTEEVPKKCLYPMPTRSKALERFMYRPPTSPDGLPANEVIASLSDCPMHFSIDEYKALGALPLGSNLVHSNILAQLAIPSVDFTKIETQCIILQAVHQAGPPSQCIERSGHSILTETSFGHAMLAQLESNLGRIEENWESWRAAATFSLLARRVLSLTRAQDVRSRALDYLETLRAVCLKWLRRLKKRVAASTDDGQRTELWSRATEVALLCTSTYDVEEPDFETVLRQKSAISTLLQSSIVVQEHCGTMQSDFTELFGISLQSWKSLMYRILPTLRNRVLEDDSGLSDAIKANWAAFEESNSSNSWCSLNENRQKQWMLTTSGNLPVHFNLLTGELLVNGLPLARLPAEYERHRMYEPLFHKSALEVVPTDELGFRFSAKTLYHGYNLHFGMTGQDMILSAFGKGTRRLELVPSRLFQGLLPESFVTDAVHWYDSNAQELLFRPMYAPWSTEDDDTRWRLVRHGTSWRLVNKDKVMICVRSPTARTISSILAPLEKPLHMHMRLVGSDNTSDLRVEIELPRLQISFEFVEASDHLRSRQFRDMIIDPDQTMGALVGMQSRLILRSAEGRRMMIIPEGSVGFAKGDLHHPEVRILEDSATRIRAYDIDETLGQITGDGSLRSRLILCYMHALTSHCLPDPLAGCTGTESAISILRSAAVGSIDLLAPEDIDLLTCLANLSATRSFYPENLKVMQRTKWDTSLPSLSQHTSLRSLVLSLLHQVGRMQFFYPDKHNDFELIRKTQKKLMSSSTAYLDERASIRTATFHVAGFGAEHFSSAEDSYYDRRDVQLHSKRGAQSHTTAKLMLRDRFSLHGPITDLKVRLLQQHFKHATILGVNRSFDPVSLRYDSKWLDDASKAIIEQWCTLQPGLAGVSTSSKNRYDIITWLSTMAYGTSDMNVIQAFAAFYISQDFSTVQPPAASTFELAKGHVFHQTTIENILHNNAKPFEDSREAMSPKSASETEEQHHNRMNSLFRQRKNSAIQNFVSGLKKQWPIQVPTLPQAAAIDTYVNVSDAMVTIRNHFYSWYDNHLFMEYLGKLSTIMARQVASPVVTPQHILTSPPKQPQLSDSTRHLSVLDVFALRPSRSIETLSLTAPSEPAVTVAKGHLPEKHSEVNERLEELCRRNMVYATSKCEREYVENLRSSCDALNSFVNSDVMHDELVADVQALLHDYLSKCQNHLETFNSALKGLFSHQVAFQTQLSPRLCTKFWLGQLHRDRFDTLSSAWKEIVIQYALAITNLQRAQRLLRLSKKPVDLVEELRHVGHSNWDVHQYPETLLIEAESGILVRAEQEFIASQMRSPKDGWNIVLQLLMGGGKSSTILPILSAFHGDRKKLVRVVIAKPQSRQMLQMLVAKLGGLLNRKVYQMPFSRNLRLNAQDAVTIREIYEECIRERGVLLIQPEHILSFKLMAVECVLIDQPETARKLLATQQWFDDVSCDCIDESDENFSTKFELIYTMGSQSSIEYAPERWLIIQDLLALILPVAKQVKEIHPEAIDIEGDGDGRYPRIRFLRPDAADLALRLLATKVVESGVGSPSRSQSPTMQAAILRYISVTELEAREIEEVEHSKFWTETTKPALLLLRGLFAGGVLNFVFSQKRYRVNFGLDNSRTPATRLAVPYRSKDSPSPRSEYSHPDVLILLSLLSWYYEGLTNDDLFDTLIHLLKSDQATIHFDEFVSTASSSLPKAFRQLSGISIRDRHQCVEEVFPGLRHSKKAVDYFVSHLVFPKELKQFPLKLSASGWDLAIRKPNPTTGFSGTNDTRHLLPLNMHQLDLPSQQHTNARVLSYLLMDETSVAHLPARAIGSTSSKDGQHLLAFIEGLHPDIRVILDCGASILDMNNREVAEAWLKLRGNDVAAVVYFEDEELSVLDRSSKIESFQTSPYAKMLDSCVVYLDESHTRGTDIPGLPRHYRAALTLGSQLTKDRLTQAAMRLRKLGNGQSVCFVVPGEIRTKIYERNGKPPGTPIDVYEVLAWAIGETWSDIKRSLPLWAVQGNRFESHKHLLLDGANTTKGTAEEFLEEEAASLETRYKPREPDDDGSKHLQDWDESNENIVKIVSRCRDFEAMGFGSAALSEEQERELAPEIEEERQIERPPRLKAHPHNFHPDLKRLIDTGEFCFSSEAWGPAFEALCTTSAARDVDLSKFPDDLLVTADFIHTVQVPPGSTRASFVSDSYQRPVQFVLSVHRKGTVSNLIIVSPYEANQLLPLLRQSKTVCLHIFAPRSNASYASVDDLMLYNVGRNFLPGSVSRSLTMQLNLFAGSLYLRSLSEYAEICDYLGLLKGTAKDGQEVYADGFIDPPAGIWGLQKSPVPFLRALLMKIRREGEGVEKTHLGRMLSGVRLEESDFVVEE
ncbi:hypothetical protein J4E85_010873 [Alternaria conjuncta]|uniref:uncharacterized protein n=1 Tax=Alternaria conjuncta TaxID=181017 RepID=UPI00221F2CD8|nr:uncharacterized protein J4E85_010873 [Alternaria conjuncta]KAI4913140.1 hypothetical protein J4E85_010873 [Alternaria conjuncta]